MSGDVLRLAVEDSGDVTAGPIALLIVLVLGAVVVLLVRSMGTRMRNVQRNAETGRWQGYDTRDGAPVQPSDPIGPRDDDLSPEGEENPPAPAP